MSYPPVSNTRRLLIVLIFQTFLFANCRFIPDRNGSTESAANQGVSSSKTAAKDPLSIHKSAIVIDMHADTTQRMVDLGLDINGRSTDGQVDAVRMKEGGLDAQFFSIWVEPSLYGGGGKGAIDRADKQIAAVKSLAEKHPETWGLALTSGDIQRIAGEGKLAALMGLEGGYAIDGKIENVERYFKMGVRYMSPTWSTSTTWAGSSGDQVGKQRGLDEFGRQVIGEMNRLGMTVDVSHVSDKTFWDIVSLSNAPVIASHSNCRALADVDRNLTDDMIIAVAKTGGVVCVVFYPEFVESGWGRKREAVDVQIAQLVRQANDSTLGDLAAKKIARDNVRIAEYAKRLPAVSLGKLVDHIDHIVKLAGIDHVGIGSDFDGVQASIDGLRDVSQLPNLTVELLKRGYSETDVAKIMGGNVLRVMDAVQRKH